jgi:hypothetical protein
VAQHLRLVALDQKSALVGQHRFLHPADRAVRIGNFLPLVIFGQHFDRQQLALVDPGCRVLHTGAGVHVDLAVAQCGIFGGSIGGVSNADKR